MPRAAGLSLAATYLFFFEYLPPFQRVHFTYDIQGFHYPLLNYALQALRHGRLPEWDPTLYCGMSFVGNIQAAIFYPPNWLLFAANLGRERMSYLSLEILVIAHFWLAWLLCYVWLASRPVQPLASALAAGVFAYSGYMTSQVQHVGVVTGYAWFPLGLWGIDEAVKRGEWRPLWKLIAASALCFLAGYPPAWFVFAVCALAYAATRGVLRRAGVVLVFSLLLVMVQLLPAIEAASMKVPELKYEGGIYGGKLYLSYFIPNFFDAGRKSIGNSDPTRQYFYLGAPALFAMLWLLRRGRLKGSMPALVIAVVSLLAFANPFGLVGALVMRSRLLGEICRDWNFLAGLTLAATILTALALDDFLRHASPHRATALATALMVAWSARQCLVREVAPGWAGALEPLTTLAVFSVGISARRKTIVKIALLATVWVDYKVFGTNKLFNAQVGSVDQYYSAAPFPRLDPAVYQELRSKPEFRIALQSTGPFPTDLRLFGLTTPQGFDPMLTRQYKGLIEKHTAFRTDRLFDLDPGNTSLLELLGVRYFLTNVSGPLYPALVHSPDFGSLPPAQSFFRVFEYLRSAPAYRWNGSVERILWTPESRQFLVRSAGGGPFVLVEQFFPGWRATVDGRPAAIEPWDGAFQAVKVGPGEHRVGFEFRSVGLRIGAILSVFSLALLMWKTRPAHAGDPKFRPASSAARPRPS